MLHIPIVHAHDVSKQIPRGKKNFHQVENVIKQLVHTSACVHRDMKQLGSLEGTKDAQLLSVTKSFRGRKWNVLKGNESDERKN